MSKPRPLRTEFLALNIFQFGPLISSSLTACCGTVGSCIATVASGGPICSVNVAASFPRNLIHQVEKERNSKRRVFAANLEAPQLEAAEGSHDERREAVEAAADWSNFAEAFPCPWSAFTAPGVQQLQGLM